MIGALFDLDHCDRWNCVLVIFLVELATYFALFAYLAWGRSRRRAAGLD